MLDSVLQKPIGLISLLDEESKYFYDTSGFLNKNRDLLHSDTIQLLSLCQREVASSFCCTLFNLMQRLAAAPHYTSSDASKPSNAKKHIPGFYKKVDSLLHSTVHLKILLSSSVSILRQFNILPEMYQVGYTKLYFRAGQIGALEGMRRHFLQGTLEVQKCFRAHRARRPLMEKLREE
ncbi:hypothetical protein Leryth_010102 [Lithospermum erythrorhizon]|nr:hypothetical protein Leryth_010102 [Lithospermum erythrorhizon]